MKKILVMSLAIVLLWSCDNKENVTIKGSYEAAAGQMLGLEMLNISSTQQIDSAKVKSNGNFKFNFDLKDTELILLKNKEGQYINLLASPEDVIELDMNDEDFLTGYTLSGSEDSEKIKSLVVQVEKTKLDLDSIFIQLEELEDLETPEAKALISAYQKIFEAQKLHNIKFIVENLSSPASVYALYQRITPEVYLLNDLKDLQYYKIVADSMKVNFPESTLTKTILNDVNERISSYNNMLALNKFSGKVIEETGHIDLNIEDPDGQSVKLSSLNGKVILVSFWASWNQESVEANNALKGIYNKYHNKGFEIYAVSMDQNKNSWRRAIDFEEYSWINVCELSYPNSRAATMYNVTTIPTSYLIDREGNIVAKNLSGNTLATWLDNLL